jgi:hypothetical protein
MSVAIWICFFPLSTSISVNLYSNKHLQSWLSRKTNDGKIALEVMGQLEGLVDDLQDVMATVETCAFLGLESRLFTLPWQHPALIPRISLLHVHSYLTLQVSSAHPRIRAPVDLVLLVHPSIHCSLVSIGVFSCYFLLSDISPSVLHTLVLSVAVGPLLHIFIVIFSLFSSRFCSCTLKTHTYIPYLGSLFWIKFPSCYYLCLVRLALRIYFPFAFTLQVSISYH